MIKILFLEDDILYAETLYEYFEEIGYKIEIVRNGVDFLEKIYISVYDFYILDLYVPLMDGFEVLKHLKDYNNNIPTMVLTSVPNSAIRAFSGGCDSFINKNSDIDEIQLRLEALYRRIYNTCTNNIILGNGFKYNIFLKILYCNNQPIEVMPLTKKLFECLLQSKTHYISLENLERCVYPASSKSKKDAIRFHIHELRKILGEKFIQSKKNFGYKLELKS